MGSVTKKPSPVVIIKKKRRILSHQDDAVQAVPDDIKPAPVMELKLTHYLRIYQPQWSVPRNNRKKQDVRRKKRRTMDGVMNLSDTVWTVLKKYSLSYGLKRGDIMHLKLAYQRMSWLLFRPVQSVGSQ